MFCDERDWIASVVSSTSCDCDCDCSCSDSDMDGGDGREEDVVGDCSDDDEDEYEVPWALISKSSACPLPFHHRIPSLHIHHSRCTVSSIVSIRLVVPSLPSSSSLHCGVGCDDRLDSDVWRSCPVLLYLR